MKTLRSNKRSRTAVKADVELNKIASLPKAAQSKKNGHRSTEPDIDWASVPAISLIFDLLDKKSLSSAACVCKAWQEEAQKNDKRWLRFWRSEISSVHSNRFENGAQPSQDNMGLWRWACANGGYRSQYRADALVQQGRYIATTFPLNRRDGPVSEVLFLDSHPEPRIVTVHVKRSTTQSVRLRGSTIKVWSVAALRKEKPLTVLYDVVKHMQMEDGRLFLWRIADDAIITTVRPKINFGLPDILQP